MDHSPNFMDMTAKQALLLAKATSRMHNDDIADASGIGPEVIKRYFREDDPYFPGLNKISKLCRAMGNTIIYDWLKANMADLLPSDAPLDTANEVARSAVEISAQSGRVCQVASDVIADNLVEPHEAAQLDAELAHLGQHVQDARERLRPVVLSGLARRLTWMRRR